MISTTPGALLIALFRLPASCVLSSVQGGALLFGIGVNPQEAPDSSCYCCLRLTRHSLTTGITSVRAALFFARRSRNNFVRWLISALTVHYISPARGLSALSITHSGVRWYVSLQPQRDVQRAFLLAIFENDEIIAIDKTRGCPLRSAEF